MKLTKTQMAYLRSAKINPSGYTYIPGGNSFETLKTLGLVEHKFSGIVEITLAGRTALADEPRQ